MILRELFDRQGVTQLDATDDEYHTEATIGPKHMIFSAERILSNREINAWEISFSEEIIDKLNNRKIYASVKTSTGHEFKVMSFVMNSLDTFMKKYQPESVQFDAIAVEPSRVSLYRKMIERYRRGYNVTEMPVSIREYDYIRFILTK